MRFWFGSRRIRFPALALEQADPNSRVNLKQAHPQLNLGNLEYVAWAAVNMQPQTDAGAKEKTSVSTSLPPVFTRVSFCWNVIQLSEIARQSARCYIRTAY